MAPRPEHPEAAPTPVRTPIVENANQDGSKKCTIECCIHEEMETDRGDEAPLRPTSVSKLARSVSNRTARPQKLCRIPPPDGGWGWMVLLGVVIGNILIIGHAKTFGVYITSLIERYDEKPSTVAWIQSIQFSFFLGFAPIASMLAERFSPRTVTLCGAIIACAGMALSSIAKSITHLYFSYGVMMGLAAVFTFTPGVMMIAKYFDRRRGLANGLGMAGNSLGGIFMPILADYLISEFSIHGGFLILGGILLNAAVGAMLWRPVEMMVPRPKNFSLIQKSQVPSLSARTATANDMCQVPLMIDMKEEVTANPVLPEEVPSEVIPSPSNLLPLAETSQGQLSSSSIAVSAVTSSSLPLIPPTCSTSVPDVSIPLTPQPPNVVSANFEVQSQPSTSPPPLSLSSGSKRKKEANQDSTEERRAFETQQSFDHQSIFSQSTASLSSFVYLSTFHLGPSFGTVEDISNLQYDDDDQEEPELNNLEDSEDEDVEDEEDEDDYDVYETVRARSDMRVDIAGLLAAGANETEGNSDTAVGVKQLETVLLSKKAITPEPTSEQVAEQQNVVEGVVTRARTASKRKSATEKIRSQSSTGQRKRVPSTRQPKPAAIIRPRNKYFDFSFFRSYVFYVMMVPLFLHSIGYPTIQMYTPMYARSLGFSTSDSARCLSFLAFADVAGRIGCAWLSDLQLCKRKYFYMTGMLLSGMMAFCLPYAKTYTELLLCTSGFGLASGAYIGLTVALFADAYGNDKVAKAHSMATMCTGIAGLAGGPFIGYVLEKTQSYIVCYTILGCCQILGGLVYFFEPWAAGKDAKKFRNQQWV